jgi:hypothetical protein
LGPGKIGDLKDKKASKFSKSSVWGGSWLAIVVNTWLNEQEEIRGYSGGV